jgi:hypothetical protein
MADRASRGALGADGAQDSGADKVRRAERTARGALRASSVKNDFPTLLSTPKIKLLMILKPLMILTSRSVSVLHVISFENLRKGSQGLEGRRQGRKKETSNQRSI